MLNSSSLEMPKSMTALQKGARSVALKSLQLIKIGSLTIEEAYKGHDVTVEHFGFAHEGQPQPQAHIRVTHPGFYGRVLKGGSIAAAEAYMDGWWDSPNLTAVTELMARNLSALDQLEAQSSFVTRAMNKVGHWLKRNSIVRAKQNIEAHYDLGNDLYQTFLDERMLYSSALYLSTSDSLEQAQIQKMDRLCQQLQITANDHVIEIGTGWGAMAIYMAQHYGCKVTTTTISEEQFVYAEAEITRLGLEAQITLLKQDYRLLEGQFDKLVSIEMIEAVGKAYLASYIEKCQSLLKPGGLMAIQAITIADQRYDYYSNNVDFIQKYIFPGGFLPSITVLTQMATRHTDFIVRDVLDIGMDYAKTLADWRLRFEAALNTVQALGYDERFVRMWRFYLCYCEGGFNARTISTIHMTLQRGQ
ncbi:cyclopropane-fatty-acyl-phospholipid synthase family protein [Vibrio fluvialis]|uniref:SAM-dependent methyltransferase n=1 Tax=Vibrio fluvialis TaxID=676 RepID=UPI00117DCF01|nr:cyclopropane-fatty-acyl-phospholipid synthase family protein [Vibrio fluvialis]MBL4245896.1 class I SAM-dependent methyltransferase [Vibrio fluvialis]MBL4256015.1 class I SAM-dependent methyltransferase [Vibrio fluvialis]MBY8019678.1 cyclopropane-fatty-acyl-phospholipid synthase family protein [Vibrio fluvialis]MBY8276554.1 cyclopropane-fatty-acyl-phospholipid synthase family protein [Vibrio fluvialis]MCG6358129.1 cyclopropane-fatty-acyl-phospholipid synthase family protein [Vibrio fluviali